MKPKIKKLHPDATVPQYANPGDAGMDICSIEQKVLEPGERYLFKTGLATEFDEGFVMFVKDKSGLAAKYGITTQAGVIEHTYRGELGIVILNTGKNPVTIEKGQKICQIVFLPVATAKVEEVQALSETKRGTGGFGSTGK